MFCSLRVAFVIFVFVEGLEGGGGARSGRSMIRFFKDCGVNPESHETLAISWHLQCSEMVLIQSEEFVKGFSKAGCSDKKDMKGQMTRVCRSLAFAAKAG